MFLKKQSGAYMHANIRPVIWSGEASFLKQAY